MNPLRGWVLTAGLAVAAVRPVSLSAQTIVPLHGIFEQSFSHTGTYVNPYVETAADVVLTAPDGSPRRIPLFWDGGTTWKVRFSPDWPGTWNWAITSLDDGLNGRSGAFAVVPSPLHGGIRKMAAFPYHFEYEDGTPFWFFGDTCWGLAAENLAKNYDRAAFDHDIDVRASQGFNVVEGEMINHGGFPNNAGGPPFFDFAAESLNPACWQELDSRIAYMNARGITAGLFLAWNNNDPAPPSWQSFPHTEAVLRYARYAAARSAPP